AYVFSWSATPYERCWVSPFGNLRIKAYLQLPGAYRSSSRPLSAPGTKASTVRPCSLNRFRSIHFNDRIKLSSDSFFSRFLVFLHYPVFKERFCSKAAMELSGIEPLTSCVQGRRSPS